MALTKISTAMWNSVPHHDTHDFNVDDVLYVDVSANRVGIGTTNPTSKLSIEGSNSGSVPLVNLVASGTGAFQRGVRLLNSGMNAGDHLMYAVGQADGTKNMGQFYFYYAGTGSNSNRISMGLHSVDDIFNILGTGNVGIRTTNPSADFQVKPSTGVGQGGAIALSREGNRSTLQAYYVINSDSYGDELYMGVGANSSDVSIGARHGSISFQTGAYAERLNINTSGNVIATVDMRAPIFYDSDDTAYYVDPNSTSKFSKVMTATSGATPRYDTAFYVLQAQHWYGDTGTQIMYIGESGNDVYVRGQMAIGGTAIQSGYALTMSGSIDMNANDIDYVSQLHFNDNVRFYDEGNDSYLNFKWGDTGPGGIKFVDGDGLIHGYVYGDGGGGFGLLDKDGQWALYTNGASELQLRSNDNIEFVVYNSYTYSPGSSRAPIFYDSDDTNYYINPASTSTLSSLDIKSVQRWYRSGNNAHQRVDARLDGTDQARMHWYGKNDADSTVNFKHAWYDGSSYINVTAASDFVYFQETSGTVSVQADGSMRAPIFYDSNDTSYYINPNGGSNVKANFTIQDNGSSSPLLDIQADDAGPWAIRLYRDDLGTGPQVYASNANEWYFNHTVAAGTTIRANGDARAPIFYDSDNTGYYLDGSSTSYLHSLTLAGGAYFRPQNWIQLDNSYGLYWPNNYGGHFYANTASTYTQFAISGSKNSYSGIYCNYSGVNGFMYDSAGNGGVYREANGRWFWYHNLGNDCMGIGTSTTSSAFNLYMDKGARMGGRADANIFYDGNNTGYYLDPNNTSNIYTLNITSQQGGFRDKAYKDIYVYGNENYYYPVVISGAAGFGWHRYSISRGYGWTAPWDPIGTGAHHAGLTFTFEWSGDIGWGGNDHNYRVIQWSQQYTTTIGGMTLPVTGGMLVWLRGGGTGGAQYRIHAPLGSTQGVTIYDGQSSVAGHSSSTTFTSANGTQYAYRTSNSSADGEINFRFPIRDSGGTISAYSDMYSPIYYDYNNTSFYAHLDSTGDAIRAAGDIIAYYSSDRRLKDNIIKIDSALDKVNAIGGYTFEWNEDSHKETGSKDVGVIAQEVEEIFPEIVQTRSNGYKAVNYEKLVPLLIEAVKELSEKVKILENK